MSDFKPMPRAAVITAGWLILLSAVGGLALGVSRNLKTPGGVDSDTGEVVAPIKAANAQPLTAPPVTEADVRRWAREELQATAVVHAAKKKADDEPTDTADTTPIGGTPPVITPAAPATANTTAPKPAQPQQIPF